MAPKPEDVLPTVVAFDEDRGGVLLHYPEPLPQLLRRTTKSVEQEIAGLGDLRANLVPAVPETWPGGVCTCLRNPAYSVEMSALDEVMIHVRDERFGWLHYVMSREQATQFAEMIVKVQAGPPRTVQGPLH